MLFSVPNVPNHGNRTNTAGTDDGTIATSAKTVNNIYDLMKEFGLGKDMSTRLCTVGTTKLNDFQVQPKSTSRIMLAPRVILGTTLSMMTVVLMLKRSEQRILRGLIARVLESNRVQTWIGTTFVLFLNIPR